MSIRVMTRVWDTSKSKGMRLLLLLAIADFANDRGEAWPSISTLAKKVRGSVRHVKRHIYALEEAGELVILARQGYRGCNVYRVTCGLTSDAEGTSDIKGTSDIGDSTSVSNVTSLVSPVAHDPPVPIKESPLGIAVGVSKTASKSNGLSLGQRYWLDQFGAKRFASKIQRDAVLVLEQEYGMEKLTAGVTWACKLGMNMGKAVVSLEKALPTWGQPKGSGITSDGRTLLKVDA